MEKTLLIIICILFLGCPFKNDKLGEFYIFNNSSERIYFQGSNTEYLTSSIYLYPELFIESKSRGDKVSVYEDEKNCRFIFFIWKESTIKRYSWKEIQQNNIYDKKYSLTLDDFRKMNWIIVYE
ncbi:hypothetical protein [Capnocytophaga sp. oral taxon 903]|jgi:hypothetical protein|uniref:hypothetical protein n=1 Tax=Capnocytophaga sp. oral taxon 903 TaxID=2748317 RepID=UPI0015BEED4C|nr:hypothetical protein [Capnocytophaga sp. oral taxon 903]NWO28351.1 hypothetical protein [Capnocytophaga sp. oral taxon 903]